MRVVMLVRNRFVRDARVLREARSLAAAGHDVTVLALRGPGLPADERTADGFRIVRAVAAGPLAGPSIASDGAFASGRRSLLSRITARMPRPQALIRVRDGALTRRFTRAALALPADVYHAHDLNTLEAAIAAARRHRAKLVYDAHELYPDLTGLGPAERARWRRLETRLIGTADAVVVPSPSRGAELVRRYGVAQPVVVMNCPPATTTAREGPRPLNALRRSGEALAVYAGGFSPNRGLEALIDAVPLGSGWRLALMGWGPLETVLRARAGTDDRIVFVPPVTADDVVTALTDADVGIVSYVPAGLNNTLAAPNKLFEYLHAGLAVAGSDLPDIRALIERHDVGTLFDPTDARSIATAVSALTSDAAALAAKRRAAREAVPLYTWEAQERALLGLYASLSHR